jgi:site-specific DNA-cytosine methylase
MGLLFKKNKTYVDKIINKLTECGYKVSSQKLFSEDFGVHRKNYNLLGKSHILQLQYHSYTWDNRTKLFFSHPLLSSKPYLFL